MAVHFKFKSARGDFDSVHIDGHCISVGSLKERIVQKLRLGNASDFDLVISSVLTDEEFLDDDFTLQENTSVLVRRVPRNAPQVGREAETVPGTVDAAPEQLDSPDGDEALSAAAEDEKIRNFVDSSALEWMRQTQEGANKTSRLGAFHRNATGHRTAPPDGYVCHRCRIPGHFIQHCPTNGDPAYHVKKLRTPMGIPKSMLVSNPDGLYALPNGDVGMLQPNEGAFAKELAGVSSGLTLAEIPSELRCPICHNAFKDAVLTTKCCFTSFCDACIRDTLLLKSTCVCGKAARADDLVPNKTLREAVELFIFGPATKSDIVKATMDEDLKNNLVNASDVTEEAKETNKSPALSDELDVEEELDYEGFDAEDLNIDEMEEEMLNSEKAPEPNSPLKSPVIEKTVGEPSTDEKEKERCQGKDNKLPQEEIIVQKPDNDVAQTNWKKPGGPGPHAVQYTGYWQASQMMGVNCRLPYGYNAFFPGSCSMPFASGVHPPFHTFNMRRPSHDLQAFRRKREWKNGYRRRPSSSPRRSRPKSRSPRPERIQHAKCNGNSHALSLPKCKAGEQAERRTSPPKSRYRRSLSSDRHHRRISPLQDHVAAETRIKSRSPSPMKRISRLGSYPRSRNLKGELRKASPRGVLENVENVEMGRRERRFQSGSRMTECTEISAKRADDFSSRKRRGSGRGSGRNRPSFCGTESIPDDHLLQSKLSRRPEPLVRTQERWNSSRPPYRGTETLHDETHDPGRLNRLRQPPDVRNGDVHALRGGKQDRLRQPVYNDDVRDDTVGAPDWRQRGRLLDRCYGNGSGVDMQCSKRPAFRGKLSVDADIRMTPESEGFGAQESWHGSYDADMEFEYPARTATLESPFEDEEGQEMARNGLVFMKRRPRLRVSMRTSNAAPAFEDAYGGEVLNEQDDLHDYSNMESEDDYPRVIRRVVSEVLPVKARLQPAESFSNVKHTERKRTAVYLPDELDLKRGAKRLRAGTGAAAWKEMDNGAVMPEMKSVFERLSYGGPAPVGVDAPAPKRRLVNGGRMVFFGDV